MISKLLCHQHKCSVFFSQSLSEKVAQKEKDYLQLEETLAMEKGSKKTAQDGLKAREQEAQGLRARLTGAEASLQKAQAELQERTEEVSKLRSVMGELEVKHAELKVERKQLEQLRDEKESHGAQQQTEISQVSRPQLRGSRRQCCTPEFGISILLGEYSFPHMYLISLQWMLHFINE